MLINGEMKMKEFFRLYKMFYDNNKWLCIISTSYLLYYVCDVLFISDYTLKDLLVFGISLILSVLFFLTANIIKKDKL